jgi:hypothetical protein
MAMRSTALVLVGGMLPLLFSAPGRAFEIYCVDGGDGTLTCQRLDDGGAAIVCVDSPSGVRTCTSPDGVVSTCVRSRGAVYSCAAGDGDPADSTRCQLTGQGTWICAPPGERPDPLLPTAPGGGPTPTDPTDNLDAGGGLTPGAGLSPLTPDATGDLQDLNPPAGQAPANPEPPPPGSGADDSPDTPEPPDIPGLDSTELTF